MSGYVEFHNVDNTKLSEFWMCNNVFKSGSINHGLQYGCSPYHDEMDKSTESLQSDIVIKKHTIKRLHFYLECMRKFATAPKSS